MSCSFRLYPLLGLPPWSKYNTTNTCNLVRQSYWQATAPFDAILQSSLSAQHPHTHIHRKPIVYVEQDLILRKGYQVWSLFLVIRFLCWVDLFDRGILGVCTFISVVLLILLLFLMDRMEWSCPAHVKSFFFFFNKSDNFVGWIYWTDVFQRCVDLFPLVLLISLLFTMDLRDWLCRDPV